jgi:hypothetical protein
VRHGELSFQVPEGWVDFSVITLAGGDSTKFAPSVTVTRQEAAAGSLKEQAHRQLKDIKKTFKGHKLVAEGEARLGEAQAYLLEHQMISPERVRVRQLQYFFTSGPDLVVVSLACADEELPARRPTLEAMAASFVVHREA